MAKEANVGPLNGIRIVEFGGIGPGPMCAMLLADLGAEVIRIDRAVSSKLGLSKPDRFNLLNRNRRSIIVDLKKKEGRETALRLISRADALIEGFRPGTMERLGLGPETCFAHSPRLVYGRMTGWGQSGPLAHAAGHDLNYISLTGVLHSLGRKGEPPALPLNLLGDFGGGALYLAFGIVSAILEARSSGKGQVVDAAMVDGAASLMTSIYGLYACGQYSDERGTNPLDGGAYYWDVYPCSDGRYVSIAPLESKFREELLQKIGLDDSSPHPDEMPAESARATLQSLFRTKTRDEWCALLEGSDACFAPVLSLEEAPRHPHMQARGTFVEVDGIVQPASAPRFSRTSPGLPTPPESPGASTMSVLSDWGFSSQEIDRLGKAGVLGGKAAG